MGLSGYWVCPCGFSVCQYWSSLPFPSFFAMCSSSFMKTSIFLFHRNFRKFWMHPTSSMGWFMGLQHFLQDLKVLFSPNTVGVLFVGFFSYNYCTPEVPELLWSWADAGVGGRGDALVLAACSALLGITAGILFQEGCSRVVSVHLVIKSNTRWNQQCPFMVTTDWIRTEFSSQAFVLVILLL